MGEDTVPYTLTRVAGENVGTYTINAAASNANYTITVVPATLTIAPKPVTVSANEIGKTYGDEEPELTATVTGAVEGDTINYTVSREEGENAGTYTITVAPGENPNYIVTVEGADFTIAPKPVTVSANAAGKTYGDEKPELTATVTGAVEGDTINYTVSREEGENAGTYTITVTPGENPNYTVTVEGAGFTIEPKPITVSANAASKTYGDEEPELTATVTGAVEGDTINYTVSREEGNNAGTYTITVTPGENPNYIVTVESADFTVSQKAITLTADDKTKVYGDADEALTATAEGLAEGDTLNYTLARAAGENAGEYEITITLGDNPNYIVTPDNGTYEITPRPVTVTADSKTKVAGTADEPLTATVTGTLEGETVNYLLVRAAGEEAGDYEITVTPGENLNYMVTAVNGVYTITAAEAPETTIPSYSLVIHYWTEDGPAAADFRATYPEGTSFNLSREGRLYSGSAACDRCDTG